MAWRSEDQRLLRRRGELLADAYHAVVHICGGTSVTLGEVQIVMEELNRHINDQTQIFMGIGISSKMGGRLSVSILSSLGDGSVRAVPAAIAPSVYRAPAAALPPATSPGAVTASTEPVKAVSLAAAPPPAEATALPANAANAANANNADAAPAAGRSRPPVASSPAGLKPDPQPGTGARKPEPPELTASNRCSLKSLEVAIPLDIRWATFWASSTSAKV